MRNTQKETRHQKTAQLWIMVVLGRAWGESWGLRASGMKSLCITIMQAPQPCNMLIHKMGEKETPDHIIYYQGKV